MRKLVIILSVLLAVSLISLFLIFQQYVDTKKDVLSYKKELSDLNKIINQLREKNADTLKEAEENIENIRNLKMAQHRISELEDTIKSLNNQISSCEGTVKSLNNQIPSFESAIKSLNNQISSSDASLKKLKVDYENLLKEKQRLEFQSVSSTHMNRDLRDNLDELIHYMGKIEAELKLEKYANEELRKQLAELTQKQEISK